MFWDWTDLGSVKHQTKAEVDDAFKVCTDAMEEFDCGTASIPVDNAARGVAAEVCARLGGSTFLSRDPSHSLDLLSKDLVGTHVVKTVMKEAKEVRDFVKIDRIDSIRLEAAESGELEETWTAVNICDTCIRINLAHGFIKRGATAERACSVVYFFINTYIKVQK